MRPQQFKPERHNLCADHCQWRVISGISASSALSAVQIHLNVRTATLVTRRLAGKTPVRRSGGRSPGKVWAPVRTSLCKCQYCIDKRYLCVPVSCPVRAIASANMCRSLRRSLTLSIILDEGLNPVHAADPASATQYSCRYPMQRAQRIHLRHPGDPRRSPTGDHRQSLNAQQVSRLEVRIMMAKPISYMRNAVNLHARRPAGRTRRDPLGDEAVKAQQGARGLIERRHRTEHLPATARQPSEPRSGVYYYYIPFPLSRVRRPTL